MYLRATEVKIDGRLPNRHRDQELRRMKSIERKVDGKWIWVDASSCDAAEFGRLDTSLAALASRMAANGFS